MVSDGRPDCTLIVPDPTEVAAVVAVTARTCGLTLAARYDGAASRAQSERGTSIAASRATQGEGWLRSRAAYE